MTHKVMQLESFYSLFNFLHSSASVKSTERGRKEIVGILFILSTVSKKHNQKIRWKKQKKEARLAAFASKMKAATTWKTNAA